MSQFLVTGEVAGLVHVAGLAHTEVGLVPVAGRGLDAVQEDDGDLTKDHVGLWTGVWTI